MAAQLFGYILSITGLCGLIVATFTNEWKILGHDNGKPAFDVKYEGLWMECSIDSSVTTCINYTSLLHQSSKIQMGRVIMIISIVLSSMATLLSIIGLRYTKCLDGNKVMKEKAAFTGGVFFMLSGLCALAVVTWFAIEIVQEFYKNDRGDRYVLGRSLIGALVAALLALFGGLLLSACSINHLRSSRHLRHSISKSPEKDYV